MKIHHLSGATLCGVGQIKPSRYFSLAGFSQVIHSFFPDPMICHCLLIEAGDRLILVDSGLGSEDLKMPSRIGVRYRTLGVDSAKSTSLLAQMKSKGFEPRDVRDIVITHLDIDHAGGITDFPWARIHVSETEFTFVKEASWIHRRRHCRAQLKSMHWKKFNVSDSTPWKNFSATQLLDLPVELLAVGLPGHTPGHVGYYLKSEQILHVGDAYFHSESLDDPNKYKLFEMLVHHDYSRAMQTQGALASLRSQESTRLICSHQAMSLD